MDFDDFVLDVIAHPGGAGDATASYAARVVSSPAGPSEQVPVSLPSREWLRNVASLFAGGRDVSRIPPPGRQAADHLRDAGHELAAMLLRGDVLARWASSLAHCENRERSLRLCLRLPLDGQGTGETHRVPWEVLRPVRSEAALAVDPDSYLVRRLVVAGRDRPPPQPGRLRVLAVTAGDLPGLPALDFEGEIAGLEAALTKVAGLDLQVVRGVGLRRLQELLESTGCHVLHVMAHGGSAWGERGGCLYLPDGRGGVEAVGGERFAGVVHEASAPGRGGGRLRLVVLNACRTAEVDAATPFTAVATALVAHAKVPAVVAMQYPIRDAAAVAFAEAFYRSLAAGGTVDEAVRRGRQRLGRDHAGEWVVPVLFSSLSSGRLFAEPPPLPRRLVASAVGAGLVVAVLALWLGVAYLGQPGSASPVEAPPKDCREPPPEARSDDSYVLSDGECLDLPWLGATLAVDFQAPPESGAVVTLTVAGDPEQQLVRAADEFFFDAGGGRYQVHVVHLDGSARRLRLRPPSRWLPPAADPVVE